MPPKWFLIARNEYRIRTSSIRPIRSFLPYIVIGILAIFVLFIAPAMIASFVNEFIAFLLSQVAVAMMQIALFMFFFIFITFPLSYTLRDVQTGQQMIFLSAPVKSSHILLGEFLGELPLYAIIIIIITGFFTALLKPLGLSIIQMTMIVIVFLIVFSSALWIGTVISALLRTRLGKATGGKDIGKALSMLIVLPALALMYAIMGGGLLESLSNPQTSETVTTILGVLPSSWGADIVTSCANHPGDITADTVVKFGGLLTFFAVSVWAGMKIAERAYSLETTTFIGSKAKPDGALYGMIKKLGSSGALFLTVFKVYTRRLQNISYIAYIVGLLIIMNIFLFQPEESSAVVEMGFFIFPLLAAFVSCDITLRGKETLFIYRKTPSGENRFLKAMLLKGWAVAIPISAIIVIVSLLLSPQTTILSLLSNTGIIMLVVAADVAFASGLFLLMPAYTERGGEFMLNVMVVVMVSIGLFAVSLIVFGGTMVLPFLHWAVGLIFLYMGKLHLNNIE